MSLHNSQDMFWPAGSFCYERHAPETTLLSQLVERHWPGFKTMLSAQGKQLTGYVVREFDDYLRCGRLEHGFLPVRCDTCHHEKLVAFSCKRRGFCRGRPVPVSWDVLAGWPSVKQQIT